MTYIQPALLLLLLALTAGLVGSRARLGRWMAAAALASVFLCSWPPFSWLASGTLEWRYPAVSIPAAPADAIVVLSAAVRPPNASQPEAALAENTYLRCRHAAWLYKHWRSVPVLATGGSAGENLIISQIMRPVLEAEGVPPAMILTEEKSTSTYENALFSAAILRAHNIRRIALVTEAYHMLRSEQCFRKQGLDVVVAPCSFRTLEFEWSWKQLLPAGRTIESNGDYLHEWIGFAWYRLSGKI